MGMFLNRAGTTGNRNGSVLFLLNVQHPLVPSLEMICLYVYLSMHGFGGPSSEEAAEISTNVFLGLSIIEHLICLCECFCSLFPWVSLSSDFGCVLELGLLVAAVNLWWQFTNYI